VGSARPTLAEVPSADLVFGDCLDADVRGGLIDVAEARTDAMRETPRTRWISLLSVLAAVSGASSAPGADSLERIDNGVVTVGIDTAKGGAIVWLSWRGHPVNAVNLHDAGRLIQQSYYAGRSLDRRADGQHASWSPWPWNPIQAGGVGSWATTTSFERTADGRLRIETPGKLWDMPDEEAAAVIRQATGFEPGLANVVRIEGELECRRDEGDRWGPPVARDQELPACYFTRSFSRVRSYLGGGRWRDEEIPLGPPWGRVRPPRRAVACFNTDGQGVAVWSPDATESWNVGPHGGGATDDPAAGPCMHLAPIAKATLGPRSVYRYGAWLVVGDESAIVDSLDRLASRRGRKPPMK
jgi:hypothetical protein